MNATVDLVAHAQQSSHLHRVSGANGGEYAGPCPKCGGRDRFHVQGRGLWMCRSCHPDWSDAIDFYRWRDGMSFQQAVAASGAEPTQREPLPDKPTFRATKEPPAYWREAAAELMEQAQRILWGDHGKRGRDWLLKRGLTEDTLRRYGIGYLPEEGKNRLGKIENGILIPRYLPGDETPRFINIRRPVGAPKYRAIAGGEMIAFGIDHIYQGIHAKVDSPVLFALEGEFDAMIVDQEAGELVGAFTAGGAQTSLDARTASIIWMVDRLIIAFDDDDEGKRSAPKALAWSGRAELAKPMPQGKDLTELHTSGGSVRTYVECHLRREQPSIKASPPKSATGLFDDQPSLLPGISPSQRADYLRRATAWYIADGMTQEQAAMAASGIHDDEWTDWLADHEAAS